MPVASAPPSFLLGIASGWAIAGLSGAYAVILSIGLLTLPSADQPIQDPWFTIMEVLILCIAPGMVAFMVALHARARPERQAFALLGVAFMSLCAVVTSSVHFAVLVLSRAPAFSADVWSRQVFSFTWPSLAYALDILAWDVFFALAALCAALSVEGVGLARVIRGLFGASAGLALFGLLGVPLSNMGVRNVGIVGYAVLFPIAAALSAVLFGRAEGGAAEVRIP